LEQDKLPHAELVEAPIDVSAADGGVLHRICPVPLTEDETRARVLHEDADLIVFDKPAGLPVHDGTKTTDHLELYLHWLQGPFPHPPRLGHRLDKDTSGCLVLGRQADALTRLGRLFAAGRVEKSYLAVVAGGPTEDAGRIDAPLRKVKVPGMSKVVVDPEGKPAATGWRVLGRGGGLALLELRPETGRMHQLRAHLAHLGIPILGDPIYAVPPDPALRLHLHARAVAVPRADGTRAEAVAPLPEHMAATLGGAGIAAG
jgi:tRNA pseudouridine32 synthase/23S rRNA pseudouridine746 synthase